MGTLLFSTLTFPHPSSIHTEWVWEFLDPNEQETRGSLQISCLKRNKVACEGFSSWFLTTKSRALRRACYSHISSLSTSPTVWGEVVPKLWDLPLSAVQNSGPIVVIGEQCSPQVRGCLTFDGHLPCQFCKPPKTESWPTSGPWTYNLPSSYASPFPTTIARTMFLSCLVACYSVVVWEVCAHTEQS